MVPLSAFAHFSPGHTPLSVNHQGQFAASTISFNLASGRSLSEAKTEIDNAVQRIGMPSTVRGAFAGTAATYQQSQSSMPLLFGAALVTIYIVLGVLYESLIHPITILSTLFSASVGAALALWLFYDPIHRHRRDRGAALDRHRQEERDHDGRLRARGGASRAQYARSDRAGLPPALSPDHDDHLRRPVRRAAAGVWNGRRLGARHPLGITIVGGLIVSQVLTLYTTPVVFIYLDEFGKRLARMWSRYYLRAGAAPIAGALSD